MQKKSVLPSQRSLKNVRKNLHDYRVLWIIAASKARAQRPKKVGFFKGEKQNFIVESIFENAAAT